MNTIVLSFLVLSVLIVSVACSDGVCNEGEDTFEDGIICICENGKFTCTSIEKACHDGEEILGEDHFCTCDNSKWNCRTPPGFLPTETDQKCPPGVRSFKQDCNTCTCDEEGWVEGCTEMQCDY